MPLPAILTVAAALLAAVAAAAPYAAAAQPGYEIETVASGLEVPWSMDMAPDGRIFFTERGGSVRIIGADGSLQAEPVLEIDTGFVESGLLGIALAPSFPDPPHVYVYHTYSEFFSTYNKVVRYTEGADGLHSPFVVIDGIPGGPIHDGGRIRFGPDGMLYVTTGDAGNMALSRDLGSTAGKILRIAPDGTIPDDNPFAGSPVYSSGHRNPQGIDWHPLTGMLAATDHGPSGERGVAHDEINVVARGASYGWPEAVGGEKAEGEVPPAVHSGDETWAPSGASFYTSDAIPEFEGMFLVAALAGKRLLAVDLAPAEGGGALAAPAVESHMAGQYGRLRDVVDGGDGSVYVLTSNRDGRGSAVDSDDRILRIVPVGQGSTGGSHGVSHGGGGGGGGGAERAEVEEVAGRQCEGGLERVFKRSDGSPACVSPATARLLVERGWAEP